MGSVMQGVLELYGTTNRLMLVYWFLGGGLAALGVALYGLAWFRDWAWD